MYFGHASEMRTLLCGLLALALANASRDDHLGLPDGKLIAFVNGTDYEVYLPTDHRSKAKKQHYMLRGRCQKDPSQCRKSSYSAFRHRRYQNLLRACTPRPDLEHCRRLLAIQQLDNPVSCCDPVTRDLETTSANLWRFTSARSDIETQRLTSMTRQATLSEKLEEQASALDGLREMLNAAEAKLDSVKLNFEKAEAGRNIWLDQIDAMVFGSSPGETQRVPGPPKPQLKYIDEIHTV